jgi:hypothetical protein
MLPAMSRWSCVALAALVVVTGCKNDECPAARNAASEELVAAHDKAVALRDRRHDEVQAAQRSIDDLKLDATELESRLRHFEDTMGCIRQPTDCCTRLATLNLHDRLPIQQAALDARSTLNLPVQVEVAMKPLTDHTFDIDAIGTGADDLGVIVPWCTKARGLIAQVRKEAPAAWNAAADERNGALMLAKESSLAVEKRIGLLEQWSAAVEKSASATIPKDAEDTRARIAMQKYQSACH